MIARFHLPSHPTLRPLLFAVLLIAWSAAQGQSCTFTGSGGSINFPALDPSVSATLTAFVDIQVRCIPASTSPSFGFSGANGSAPLQMKHATQNAFIPYTVAAANLGGGSTKTIRITGTVLAVNYQNAFVGSYFDTLQTTVLP